jgi:hypothetical protein
MAQEQQKEKRQTGERKVRRNHLSGAWGKKRLRKVKVRVSAGQEQARKTTALGLGFQGCSPGYVFRPIGGGLDLSFGLSRRATSATETSRV